MTLYKRLIAATAGISAKPSAAHTTVDGKHHCCYKKDFLQTSCKIYGKSSADGWILHLLCIAVL